jgi:gliding motility-associated-like protein
LGNNPTTPLIDNNVTCGKEYCYEIKAIESDGIATSVSVKKCVTAVSTIKPESPYLISSFNKNNQVILSLVLPQGKESKQVKFEKSTNSGVFKTLTTTQKISFTDAIKELANICYKASFTDLCNNTSESSNVSCPIILQTKKQADGSIELRWSDYVGFPSPVQKYIVELLDASGTPIESSDINGIDNSYIDQNPNTELQFLRYRIKAESSFGNEVTYSNIQELEQELQLYIPSAFTPNDDEYKLNETFKVIGKLFSDFSIKVYNNQGSVVYHSTDAEAGWDGTFKGKQMPAGVYAYEIIVKTSFGLTKRRTGTITLLR